MNLTTQLPFASSPIIETFFKTIGTETKTASQPVAVKRVDAAVKTKSIDLGDFISELCAEDPRLDATISEGTKWVAEAFYADQPDSFKKARMKAGLTQTQLAKKINTSQSYIAKLEGGEVSAGLDVIGRLAKALLIDPKDVFGLLFAEYEKRNG